MILTELTGIKHLKDKSPKEIIEYIRHMYKIGNTKLRLLGSGMNGAALTDGSNVFKFWYKDSAYEDFVRLCVREKGNPMLPVFKSDVRTLPLFLMGNKLRFVVMELLSPIGSNYKISVSDSERPTLLSYFCESINDYVNSNKTFDDEGVQTVLEEVYGVDCRLNEQGMNFFNTIREIIEDDFGEKGHISDLHNGNFALRGSQLVILDPIMNSDDFDINLKFLNM